MKPNAVCGIEHLVELPFVCVEVSAAGLSIPGTVGVSGQTAVGTCLPVGMATVQGHLGDPMLGADVKLLL